MDKMEIHTIAYSPNQKQFHIEPLSESLVRNRRNCLLNHHDEYFIIDVAPDYKSAHALTEKYEETGKYPRSSS